MVRDRRLTQVDLERDQRAGLVVVGESSEDGEGIEFVRLHSDDVLRQTSSSADRGGLDDTLRGRPPELRRASR